MKRGGKALRRLVRRMRQLEEHRARRRAKGRK